MKTRRCVLPAAGGKSEPSREAASRLDLAATRAGTVGGLNRVETHVGLRRWRRPRAIRRSPRLNRRPARAVAGIPNVIRHPDSRSCPGDSASSCPTRRWTVPEQARFDWRPGRPLVEAGQHGRDQPGKLQQGSARPGPKLETNAIRTTPIRKFNRTDARELIVDEGSPRL